MIKLSLNSHHTLALGFLILTGGSIAYLTCGPSAKAANHPEAIAARKTITTFLRDGQEQVQRMQSELASADRAAGRLNRSPAASQIPLSELNGNPFHSVTAGSSTAVVQDRMTLLNAVKKLQLQSIMSSDDAPACAINDNVYREGQSIDAFTVDSITDSTVVVRSGEYRFELKVRQ